MKAVIATMGHRQFFEHALGIVRAHVHGDIDMLINRRHWLATLYVCIDHHMGIGQVLNRIQINIGQEQGLLSW